MLKSNGLPRPKIRLKKFGFSSKTVPANIAKKLPSQRCSQPVLIAFSTSRTNGPRSLLQAKAGTHSAFRERSHTAAYTSKQGPSLLRTQRGFAPPAKSPPKGKPEKSGCTPVACVRFLRRRGPAGLRDPAAIVHAPTPRTA